jgi:peptidoglycan/xylan/chitin deacetylase (PgdA/CDA1 family)
MSVIRPIKRAVFASARGLGVSSLVRDSAWRSSRLMILCYHGVSIDDEHLWNPGLYMRPETLAGRFAMLEREGFTVLPLEDALRRLQQGTLPKRAVALTFDDGMYNFYAQAFPLLVSHAFAATVYLSTFYCEFNRPVFTMAVSYALWKARESRLQLGEFIPGERRYDLSDPDERAAVESIMERHASAAKLDAAEKDALVERLAAALGVDWPEIVRRGIQRVMNPDEVAEVSRAGMSIELHTHRHRSPDDHRLFLREITDNRQRIESLTGKTATHFCYPSGQYRLHWSEWLREAGVVSATTCDPGLAAQETSPLLLPRFVDSEAVTNEEFSAWVSGVAQLLPRRTRYAHPEMRST